MAAAYEQTIVAAYANHAQAEAAVRRLQEAGVAKEHLSLIGHNWQPGEEVHGYYQPDQTVADAAGAGAVGGGMFGLLLGFSFFLIPALGPLFLLGPVAGLLAGAATGAGIGALVGVFEKLGIPREHAERYQARLKAGEFLVLVHGPAAEVARARELLEGTGATSVEGHAG
jgi:uncharacterized membrane protein